MTRGKILVTKSNFLAEFLASGYLMVAMSEENASSLTVHLNYFVIFCRTR